MSDATGRALRALLRRRRSILAIVGLVAVAFVPGLLRLESDNSPAVFYLRGSEELARYEALRAVYGSDASLRVVVEGADLWTRDGLRWLGALETSLAEVDGVVSASGLAGHYERSGWPPRDPTAFRERVVKSPLDRGAGWVSRDGAVATVLVLLDGAAAGSSETAFDREPERTLAELLESLEAAAATPEGLALETRLLGLPVLNSTLDRSSREIDRVFFPLLALFTVVILWLTIRDLPDLVPPLAFVALCLLLTLAPMGYAGARLNLVLAVLPPIILSIALATALHLVLRFRQLATIDGCAPPTRSDRVHGTMHEKGWSVFWTGVTTAIGFASLAISPVLPVRHLGLWASFGLAMMTLAAFTALPVLLATLGARRPHPEAPCADGGAFEHRVSLWGRGWGRFASTHRRGVLLCAGFLGLVALAGVPRIHIESNALNYLEADHPLRTGIESLEAAGIGIAAVEVLLEGRDEELFRSALAVDRLADLAVDLETEEGILGAVSAGTVLRDAARSVPTTPMNATVRLQMILAALQEDLQGREALAAFLGPDRRQARVTAFIETGGAGEVGRIQERARAAAARHFPEASVEVTGEYPLLLESQRHLLSTLTASLGLTLVAIAIVLRFLLPSFRLTLLALLPNLWPVVGALGAMGWLGIPLDIATVMVASIVLGLAVDDTIHTLGHFRILAPRLGARAAVAETLAATAPAYLLTGVILVAGFGVCSFSDFAPIANFGSLAAVAIALAVLGDLFLLPALLSFTPRSAVGRLSCSVPTAEEAVASEVAADVAVDATPGDSDQGAA